MSMRAQRPVPDEHHPYYRGYIDKTPDGDLGETLVAQCEGVRRLFDGMNDAAATVRYAPEKWTLQDVLGHLTDTERVFGYRAAHFSRRDPAPLPSFDQDAWLLQGGYGRRSLVEVVEEWVAVREATIHLVAALTDEAWSFTGVASDRVFSVRSALWIIPGHVNHHLELITARYLPLVPGAVVDRTGAS